MGEFEGFSESAQVSLLSEQFGNAAWSGVGRISAVLLLAALVGRLLGHVVARFALSICGLMHAFWTGKVGPAPLGARESVLTPLRSARPASQPAVETLVHLPNA